MQTELLRTPVALFVFKRPETTRRVFEVISKAQPAKLLLIADGPRHDREEEVEACREVRDIVTRIDWPCEVSTNFATSNLGCQERVISGLDWVFGLVEEAIILEDDCLPDSSFFPFCQELLERYRGDSRISSIAGTNLTQRYVNTKSSYYFSELGGIWGWATWRSEWQKYDRHLTDWPKLKNEKMLSEIFDHPKAVAYWTAIFDAVHTNRGPDTWDYQWLYTRLKNNALTVVPRSNLIANIGFGCDATNTSVADARFTPPLTTMKFPLQHPSSFVPSRSIDVRLQGLFTTSLAHLIPRKLRRISSRLFKG